ncbi:MAG: helix-turn-helix domain-containing protein [Spirochaetota bacterium]
MATMRIAFFSSDAQIIFSQHAMTVDLMRGVAEESCRYAAGVDYFDDRVRLNDLLKKRAYKRYDGLIAAMPLAQPGEVRAWRALERLLPCVNVLENGGPDSNVVKLDDEQAIDLIVSHLVAEGHPSVGFYGAGSLSFTRRRRHALLRSAQRYGIEVRLPQRSASSRGETSKYEDVFSTMARGQHPSALVFDNDYSAYLFWIYADKRRIRIPDTIAITGIDNIVYPHSIISASDAAPGPRPLTTVDIEAHETGRMAVRMLAEIVQRKRPARGQRILIEPRLIVRGSSLRKSRPVQRSAGEGNVFRSSVIDYCSRRSSSAANIRQIARRFGMSHAYFLIKFKKEFRVTFTSYVNNIRLDRAAFYLRSTAMTVTDIYFEVGYKSHEHFNRFFKKRFGLLPTVYRKRNASVHQAH